MSFQATEVPTPQNNKHRPAINYSVKLDPVNPVPTTIAPHIACVTGALWAKRNRFRPAKAPVMQATPHMIENETYM